MVTNLPANAGDTRDTGSIPGPGRSHGKGMAAPSSILSGESHGRRSLAAYSPWGRKESDTTEPLSTQSVYKCLSAIPLDSQ